MITVSSLWLPASGNALSPEFSDAETMALGEIICSAAIEDGAGGVTLFGRHTPPYSEAAYFATNLVASLDGKSPNAEKAISHVLDYVSAFRSDTLLFAEVGELGYEFFTLYYCLSILSMFGEWNEPIADHHIEAMIEQFHETENNVQNEIHSLFWLTSVIRYTGRIDRYKADIYDSLVKFASHDGGFGALPVNLEDGSLPATGRALLIASWINSLHEFDPLNFITRCVRDNAFTEKTNSGPTWDAMKWGHVASFLIGFRAPVLLPKVNKKLDLWRAHAICVARTLSLD